MRNKIFFVLFSLFISVGAVAQVTVTSSDSISCSTLCTTLTSHVTGDAPINSLIDADDYYPATTHPIGFSFNYYGTTYTSCLIGPNGTINFNLADAGAYADYTISNTLATDPTLLNSIAGPYCDIDITAGAGGIITYSTTGTAPFRKFIVSFCSDPMYSCVTQTTTTQIILYETTNIIECHIGQKLICAWNGGYAIIGVKNASGSASTAAPGRDFPNVYTCTNEAWRFTPDATYANYSVASIPYAPIPLASSAVYWYNNNTGAFLGTGATMSVCPTTTTTYKAGALTCSDTSFGYYTVVPSATVSAAFTAAALTVCGATTTITVSGMMPDSVYQLYYTFNGVPVGPITITASPTGTYIISGAAAGAYTNMYITKGACSSAPQSLTITAPPITISATAYPPTVCGYNDAYIVLTGYTPATTYTIAYTKNGTPITGASYTSNGVGTITLTGLSAGTYTNIVSTGGPCPPSTVAGPLNIANPPGPTVTVDSALVKTCVGSSVQLHSYASPTGIAYTYTWSPATALSNAAIANPIVTPTTAGNVTYTVTVNPSPSVPACAGTATLTVHTIGDFSITTPTANICLLAPPTGVPVSISGSTEISYLWTPGAPEVSPANSMTPTITPTTPGTHVYTVTGTYANCPPYVHNYTINVEVPPTGMILRDTICLGMSDVIDVSASGGPGYHYAWTSSPTGVVFSNDTIAAPTFTPPAVGTYTLSVYVTSPAATTGCGVRDSIFLLVLPNTLTISPVDTQICLGQVVQATGTIAYSNLFTYQWLPTAGIANPDILNALIAPDTSQLYTVTASFHRCPDITATLNIDVQPTPIVFVGGNRPVCQFDTLHIHANVSPMWYDNYQYSWTPAAVLDNTTSSTVVFNGTSNTNVVVTVTTPAGCTGKDSAYVTVNPGNFITPIADEDFCPHQTKVINLGASVSATYRWLPSMYVSDSTSNTPVLAPITTTTYTIVGTSAFGCRDTIFWKATVHPDAVIELGDDVTLYAGESYQMNPLTNCTSFLWFPITGLSSPFISDPVATPDVSTIYILTGTTEHGCVARDSIAVFVNDESLVAMPNAFTPGNGINNTFKVILRGVANLNYFRVYNRWGNLLFETKNINEGWDGSYKGEQQPGAVYVYDVQAVTSTGKIVQKSGNVTLLR